MTARDTARSCLWVCLLLVLLIVGWILTALLVLMIAEAFGVPHDVRAIRRLGPVPAHQIACGIVVAYGHLNEEGNT